jgi:hypothetical protein
MQVRQAKDPIVKLILAIAAAIAATIPANADATACRMSDADARWIVGALSAWRIAESDLLHLAAAPLPQIVVVDAACTYRAPAGGPDNPTWLGTPHDGMAVLPDGQSIPLGPISFAAPDNGDAASAFFAMSLPSVWQEAGVSSSLGLERLMDGVLLHELMHTRQFYFANPALAAITAANGLPDDVSDNSLQARFGSDAAYRAAYEHERDLLFAAAAAPFDNDARRIAAEALAALHARRAAWFKGDAAYWAQLDDIFLTMEGLGQWIAYAWLKSSAPDMPAADLLEAVRRGGKQWTQDEGLALFLVVDRLVPDWQTSAFAAEPQLAEALLARATGQGR